MAEGQQAGFQVEGAPGGLLCGEEALSTSVGPGPECEGWVGRGGS